MANDGEFSSTFAVDEHLFARWTFLESRMSTVEGVSKAGLRRVKSVGDLPSPIHQQTGDLPSPTHTLPRVDIGPPQPEVPLPTLLGSQAVVETNGLKKGGRRRNRRAQTAVEGKVERPACEQDVKVDDLANSLKEATSSQAVLSIAHEYMTHFDFPLIVLAIHAAAKHAASNPASCTDSNIFGILVRRMHDELKWFLKVASPSTDMAHQLTDVLYAFAKLDVIGYHEVIYDIAKAMPPFLQRCSTVELSTALWSLGRLAPAEAPNNSMTQEARQLAALILGHISKRPMDEFTPHCISEVLYAKARLELEKNEASRSILQGRQVQNFLEECKNVIIRRPSLHDFSTQGLANMVWALAKTHVKANRGASVACGRSTGEVSMKIMSDARTRLGSFEMLELSMTAWAIAKLHGKNEGALVPESFSEVGAFITAVAAESVRRFELMSSQSISNIAWAITKLDRMSDSSAHSFFTKAMAALMSKPEQFSPQAISNLCYAVSWLNSRSRTRTPKELRDLMHHFAEVAAYQSLARECEFKWQDLSGVLVAIAPRFQNDESPLGKGECTKRLAERLGWRVAFEGHQLTTQVGLNIAVAAMRVGLPQEILSQVTCTMSQVIAGRTPRVNNHDLRQFKELQDHSDAKTQKFQ